MTDSHVPVATAPVQLRPVDRYTLSDAILAAWHKHGNDSWCSIADEVIAALAPERLKGQWPEPIRDHAPTAADADDNGDVLWLTGDHEWLRYHWTSGGDLAYGWLHTPRWQPPAPPTLKERALKALDGLGTQPASTFRQLDPFTEELIRRALEAGS